MCLATYIRPLVYLLLRSRHGLALTAIRDSEAASGSLGVDNFQTKVWVYIVAAFGTGMVGALVFLTKLRISPEAGFSVVDWTANVISIVVIGGIGTIEGPIVGVIVFFVLRELLADFGSWYLIVLGAAAVIMMLRAPQGVWGLIAERFDFRFFPVQRRLVFDPARSPSSPTPAGKRRRDHDGSLHLRRDQDADRAFRRRARRRPAGRSRCGADRRTDGAQRRRGLVGR